MADQTGQMDSSRIPRRELWLIGMLLVATAIVYRYAWLPNDPEQALHRANQTLGLPVTEVHSWFSAWTLGDGQAFAVIATDPLAQDGGILLGSPAYRYARSGFGWLSWLASLGRPEWVPYGMAVIGAVALISCFVLAARLRPQLGRAAWLIAVNPSVLIAFAGDTAETLGVLALAYALATGRWWVSVGLGLVRPSFLAGLFGRWHLFLPGVTATVVFGLIWIIRFGFDPGQYGEPLSLPLVGYWSQPSVSSLALAGLAGITVIRGATARNWGWLVSGLLVLCFSEAVLVVSENGWRTAGMLFVLWAFGPRWVVPRSAEMRLKMKATTA